MASGDPNNHEGPMRNSIRPSMRHSLTQEDEKLLQEQEKIIEAHYEWLWPHLEPLWNPKSRVHWITNISALQEFHNSREQNDPLSATLLLSAARHGDAILLGSKTLRRLVMQSFCHPLNPSDWDKIKKIPGNLWKDCSCKREIAKHTHPWKPLNYYKTMAKIDIERSLVEKNFQELEKSVNSTPKRVSIEESQPLKYLENLFRKHLVEKDCRKRQSRSLKIHVLSCEWDIDLEPVDRQAAWEPECPICRETLLDHKDVYNTICEGARKRLIQPPCMAMKLAHAGCAAEEFEDARWFVKCLSDSCDALKKTIEEPKCVQAVKLSCGHTMGLDCIEAWIMWDNSTCPVCRAHLENARSTPDRPARRGTDVVMIDPGDGAPLEEAIVVEHPLDEDHPEESSVVDQWDNPLDEEIVLYRRFLNSINAQSEVSRVMDPMWGGRNTETPPLDAAEGYYVLLEELVPENLSVLDGNLLAVEAPTINREQLSEIDNNSAGNIPRPIYSLEDSRTESNMEGENLSSPASGVSEPNHISPLRQASVETLLSYGWEASPDIAVTEMFDVSGDELMFRGPRNAANGVPPILSPFPTPFTSDEQEALQEQRSLFRSSRRLVDLDSDIDIIRQDQPNRRRGAEN